MMTWQMPCDLRMPRQSARAIVAAIQDFNRRRRMAELIKHAGTCTDLLTVEELQSQRRKG